jgi:hypothetical protein
MTEIQVVYEFSPDTIRAELAPLAAVRFDEPKEYARGVKALTKCASIRTSIEKRRKELKADSLEYGRRVDSVAKQLTSIVEEIESPIRAARQLVDDEAARIKREAEEAVRAAAEAEARAIREAEEALVRAEQEAAAEALRIEREKLAAERAEMERQMAEVAAARRAEEARAAEARRVEEERARVEREKLEAERMAIAQAKAIEEAKAAERARVEREHSEMVERRRQEAEQRAAEERRQAALAPDREKLAGYAARLRDVRIPDVSDSRANEALAQAVRTVDAVAGRLENWK